VVFREIGPGLESSGMAPGSARCFAKQSGTKFRLATRVKRQTVSGA